MIKRFWAFLLCICIIFQSISVDAFAAEIDDNAYVDGQLPFTAVNISGVGSGDQIGMNATGFYGSIEAEDHNDKFKNRYMSYASSLMYGDEYEFYVKESSETTKYIRFFSSYDLDEAKISVVDSEGKSYSGEFEKDCYGDNGGELYYYSAEIKIPANNCDFSILYNNQKYYTFEMRHIPTYWMPNEPFLTGIDVSGYTEDKNGNITAFSIEVSGFDLPTDPELYRFGRDLLDEESPESPITVTDISEMDEYGRMIFTCDVVEVEDFNLLVWPQLALVGDGGLHILHMFQKENLYDYETGYKNINMTGEYWGSQTAQIGCPYYTLNGSGSMKLRKPSIKMPSYSEESIIKIDCKNGDYQNVEICISKDGGETFGEWMPLTETIDIDMGVKNTTYQMVFKFRGDELEEYKTKTYNLELNVPEKDPAVVPQVTMPNQTEDTSINANIDFGSYEDGKMCYIVSRTLINPEDMPEPDVDVATSTNVILTEDENLYGDYYVTFAFKKDGLKRYTTSEFVIDYNDGKSAAPTSVGVENNKGEAVENNDGILLLAGLPNSTFCFYANSYSNQRYEILFYDNNDELKMTKNMSWNSVNKRYEIILSMPNVKDMAKAVMRAKAGSNGKTGHEKEVIYSILNTEVEFLNIPAEYAGTSLILKNGVYNKTFFVDNSGKIEACELPAGTYSYEFVGEAGHIEGGTKTIARGEDFDFQGLPAIHSLEISATQVVGKPVEVSVELTITTPDGKSHKASGTPGSILKQIPDGSVVTAVAKYDSSEFPEIFMTGNATRTFTLNSDETVSYVFEALKMRKVYGSAAYMDYGKYRSNCGSIVTITQEIPRGDHTETYTQTVLAGTAGKFELAAYCGIAGKLEIRYKDKYGVYEIPADDNNFNNGGKYFVMDKSCGMTILVDLDYDVPQIINADGVNESVSKKGTLDSYYLTVRSIEQDGVQYFEDSFKTDIVKNKLIVTIPEETTSKFNKSNNTIYLGVNKQFTANGIDYWIEKNYVEIKYDNSSNLVVNYTARQLTGSIIGTVEDDADSGMVGFLALDYGNKWFGSVYTYGTGELQLDYSYEGPGRILAFTVPKEDVADMVELLRTDKLKVYDVVGDSIVSKPMNIVRGNCYRVGTMKPKKSITSIVLSPYRLNYDVKLTEINNKIYANVYGTLKKRTVDTPDRNVITRLKMFGETYGNSSFYEEEQLQLRVNGEYTEEWYNFDHYNRAKDYNEIKFQTAVQIDHHNAIHFRIELKYKNSNNNEEQLQTNDIYKVLNIFSLEAPEFVGIASDGSYGSYCSSSFYVSVRTFPSQTEEDEKVTIYDNGIPIKTFNVTQGYFQERDVRISLTDPTTEDTHVIWASREYNGEVINTEPKLVTIVDNIVRNTYISDFRWDVYPASADASWTHNPIRLQRLSDLANTVISIWADTRSDMGFKINNAPADRIKNVWLNMTFLDGTSGKYQMYHDTKVKNDDPYSSYWAIDYAPIEQHFKTFSVDIEFAEDDYSEMDYFKAREKALEHFYEYAGYGKPSDENNLIKEISTASKEELEQMANESYDDLPDELKGLNLKITKNTDDSFKVEATNSTKDIKDYSVSMDKLPETNVNSLYLQMEKERETGKSTIAGEEGYDVAWVEYESVQGRILVRMLTYEEKTKEGTYHTITKQQTYVPGDTVDQFEDAITPSAKLLSNNSGDSSNNKNIVSFDLLAADSSDGSIFKKTFDTTYKGYSVVSEINGYADMANSFYTKAVYDAEMYITHSKDVAKEAADKASFIPKKFGDAMNILGVADTVYSIAKGPEGSNTAQLRNLLNRIEDPRARVSLERQLDDFDSLKKSIYAQDMTMKTISSSASFYTPAGLWTKVTLFVGGLANGAISNKSKELNEEVYKTTMYDIFRQIQLENYKKEHRQEIENAEKEFRDKMDRIYGKGYWSEHLLNEEKSYYVLTKGEDGKLHYIWKEKAPNFSVYVDPSGFVFEGDESNVLEGVTASIYYSNTLDENGEPTDFSLWNDGNPNEAAKQQNPLFTDLDGTYRWDVPYGWWKVRYEKEGYQTIESIVMEVPPEHTAVNIGMLSTTAPAVKLSKTDGQINIMFSQYMQLG